MHYGNVLVEQKCPFWLLSQSMRRGINVSGLSQTNMQRLQRRSKEQCIEKWKK
jgi:post-segregation antitoxin (ccd killing protein)